jgi:uncharacterized protein (UPF0128 family)
MQLTEGIYTLEGNKFYVNGKKFYIRERKKDLEKKPKYYLAHISPNNFQYISSLFPSGAEGKYNFDYQQELFELELLEGEGKAILKKIEAISEVEAT